MKKPRVSKIYRKELARFRIPTYQNAKEYLMSFITCKISSVARIDRMFRLTSLVGVVIVSARYRWTISDSPRRMSAV